MLLLFLILCTKGGVYAQQRRLSIMEYNVENLFDTLYTEHLQDEEFTPQGSHQWTSRRYLAKLSRLSRVIAGVGGLQPVDLVALVEVENDSVLTHLTQRTKLWREGYQYLISHSPDRRGVNVALLYQPHRFRPFLKDSLRVLPIDPKLRPTRDVMHVAGELFTGDTLDVFVCHLPSRRGGKSAQTFRELWGKRLRCYVDSVMQLRQRPKVVITGDFNAYYPEPLFTECLSVKLPPETSIRSASALSSSSNSSSNSFSNSKSEKSLISEDYSPSSLYLLSYALKASHNITGTYKFQGEWNQLDHFIVNGGLLRPSAAIESFSHKDDVARGEIGDQDKVIGGLFTSPRDCRIVDFDFLLESERSGEGVRPKRTYLGNYYHGGFSDHLPMVLYLNY